MRVLILVAAITATTPVFAQQLEWAAARTVGIDMKNFAYTPTMITLQRGVPYRLRFVNGAGGGHNFVAKDFFAQATLDPANGPIAHKGEVELSGGKSTDVRLVANRAGIYDVHCSHFLHSTFGMKGKIVVQ